MSGSPRAALYSPAMLALAVELADFPFDPAAPLQGQARSRTCGSTIALSADCDSEARLFGIGMRVSACAVGQASAAIFAREAREMGIGEVGSVLHELGSWLEGKAPSSILPRLELLEPARPHKGRHEAILLPWRAALDALSKAESAR
ncbi:iron-sulfur cluster assembly scaffold protein [Qipengyuania sp. 6B39]|uniref:iron-sulfur cluster assembly scaffold protein n=1 Tax=Qipengyuania proteolytica TaxID=2867239 RepID=UPI001C8AB6AE|nr:iron-sulfur cluster assembly scaffold protein [Qipengyuania proteolytica]MBX7496092.1 iron-sulfur cluster assembly scaffold protein [Qipengyuania proteolytica]